MSGGANNHVGAHVDKAAEEFGLSGNWAVASRIFYAVIGVAITFGVLDINNDVILFSFGSGDLRASGGFVINIRTGVIGAGTLTVFFGRSGVIYGEPSKVGTFFGKLKWNGNWKGSGQRSA